MLALHGQREPIDLVTLGDELRRRDRLDGVGGPAYLTTPDERGPDRRPCRALRADRRAQGGAAQPDRRRRQDRGGRATRRRTTPRSPSTGPSRSCSRSASDARTAGSRRCRSSSARPTTGSSTSTSIAARSSACPPAWPSWMPCSAGSSPRTSSSWPRAHRSERPSLALNVAPARRGPRGEAGRRSSASR